MRTELISIETDTQPLDGAYYTPEDSVPWGGVLLMHGNTMNFYTGAPRFLPPYLTALGYACLAYNRRGHDILSIRNSRAAEGAAFQTAAQGMADNEYAARFLAQRGFAAPVVIGHSNGGMLAAQYAARHPEVRALVLLSAHGGGARILAQSCAVGQLAGDRLESTLAEAQRLVALGRGRELLQVTGWWYVISAESFVDRAFHTPDTLEAAPRIRCPTLYIRGSLESAEIYPAEEFQRRAGGPTDVALIEGGDHFYKGVEARVAQRVADWLARVVAEPPRPRA